MHRPFDIHRRQLLKTLSYSALGVSASGWLPGFAAALANNPQRRRHCILLWMSGGPAQTDTFDLKPDHENGGEFKEIQTTAPGLRFSEHLPNLAKHADKLAVIRGLKTQEGDHQRGTYLMRTGRRPMGPIQYPCIGAGFAKMLGESTDTLPNYISIAPSLAVSRDAVSPGFLGPRYSPLLIGAMEAGQAPAAGDDGFAQLRVESLEAPNGVSPQRIEMRRKVWRNLQQRFLQQHPNDSAKSHDTIYESTIDLLTGSTAKAFDLSGEPRELRERYGTGRFGQGCLMARRLIEHGAAFVEVSLDGWDTHADNFNQVQQLSEQLDAGWSTLMSDLEEKGLLESTTILWMGEFGRTPRINNSVGRDHFPNAWSCVLAGGGIAGGQAYGRTSADGMKIEENPVECSDVLATLCEALGVEPSTDFISNVGRPIPFVEGNSISDLLA